MASKISGLCIVLLFAPFCLIGQEFGQWSWEASVAAVQRSYQNSTDGIVSSDYRERDLRLRFDVNGFVLHPAIGDFSASVTSDADRHNLSGNRKELGYRVFLSLLPQSATPIQIYAGRTKYDYYQTTAPDDPLSIYGVPDRGTSLGGRVRFMTGLLRGLQASLDRTSIDMAGPVGSTDRSSLDDLDWTRRSEHLQQHYQVRRESRFMALADYGWNDSSVTADDQGTFAKSHWGVSGMALRRTLSAERASPFTTGHGAGWVSTDIDDRSSWTSRLETDLSSGAGAENQTHRLEAGYQRSFAHGIFVTPAVFYGLQRSDGFRFNAPGARVNGSWGANVSTVSFALNAGIGAARMDASGPGVHKGQTQFFYSGLVSLGHAMSDRLSERVEGSVSRNQLRASTSVEGQPGFGVVGSIGTEDADQVRLSVDGRVGILTLAAYSDWVTRRSALSSGGRFEVTTQTENVQVGAGKLRIFGSAGTTEAVTTTSQRIRFSSIGATISPFPFLSLSGNYRTDVRTALLEPKIDGKRVDFGGSLRLGAFYVNPIAFRMTERLEGGGSRRDNRGLTITIARDFGGWLPIVTGARRRGSIE